MAGRHRNGSASRGLAGWVIPAVVAIIVVIALVVGWLWLSGSAEKSRRDQSQDCIEGELELPIAEAFPGAAHAALEAYSQTRPVVRDHCIVPKVAQLAQAAVYVGVDSPAADEALKVAERKRAASSPKVIGVEKVGLAARTAPDAAEIKAADAQYPAGETVDASVAAAVALATDDAEARAALSSGEDSGDKPVAIFEGQAPEDMEFRALPGVFAEISAIPLVSAGRTGAAEEAERAAGDFIEKSAAAFKDSEAAKELPEGADDAAGPAASGLVLPRPADVSVLYRAAGVAVGPAEPVDTLFMLDTSSSAAALVGAAPAALGPVAQALGADGHQVALWNYSSPLHPGVVNPWRENLDFGDGAEIETILGELGSDGAAMSRTALVAAAQKAAAHSAETGTATRVVLVTTGTSPEDIDKDEFTAELAGALGEAEGAAGDAGAKVEIAVIHVGAGEADQAIAGAADSSAQAGPGELAEVAQQQAGITAN